MVIYATSNRRHLLAEKNSDNARSALVDGELHHGEAVEEKISLSDRFGLWLSFYPVRQDEYLDMVSRAVEKRSGNLRVRKCQAMTSQPESYRQEALRWALGRGVRNGRSAEHFARHWVGQQLLKQQNLTNLKVLIMFRMLCIVAALGHSSLALADTLIMQNGDRITGRLDSISGGKAVFETPYAGRILVSLEQIDALVTDDAYTVRIGDHRVWTGASPRKTKGRSCQPSGALNHLP